MKATIIHVENLRCLKRIRETLRKYDTGLDVEPVEGEALAVTYFGQPTTRDDVEKALKNIEGVTGVKTHRLGLFLLD